MNIAVISDIKYEYSYKGCNITFIPSENEVCPTDWCRFEAAFLIAPVSDKTVINWTGHPHLRYINGIDELKCELEFLGRGVEIEKKLLIKMPDFVMLSKYNPFKAEIEQIYLVGEDGSHRIRKRVMNGTVSYVETVKRRVSPTVSEESEKAISEEEYKALALKADTEKHPIIKDRYCFFYNKQYFELDVYDFWNDRATLELELKSENESYALPPEIELIKDVSDDIRYKNSRLAGVKYEDYYTDVL